METEVSSAEDTGVDTDATLDVSSDAEPSTATHEDVDAGSSAAEDTQDAKEPASLLDAVQAAVETSAGEDSSDLGEGSQDVEAEAAPEGEAEADGELKGDPTEEELKTYKPATRARFEKLLGERNEYRESHKHLQGILSFVGDAGLSTDEVNNGFEIMRLMKQEPAQALQALVPYVEALMKATGEFVPEDLQERVDGGYIDEDAAKEISRLRSKERLSERQSTESSEQARTEFAEDLRSSLNDWERQWSGSDPDFALKQPRVQEKMKLYVLEHGFPPSKAAALNLAENAKQAVENEMKPFIQRKQAVTPVTGGSSAKATVEPSSMLEAISQAAGR